jgi:hypothetical protein
MTATPTFTPDYTQEMHEGYRLDGLAMEMQRAARFVGHLAQRIPQDWNDPSDLYDYMDVLAAASLEAGNRIAEQRAKIDGPHDLETASAEVLVDLAAINAVASAWEGSDEPGNTLLTGGWWINVASHAGGRLQKYANIGDEWAAGEGATETLQEVGA